MTLTLYNVIMIWLDINAVFCAILLLPVSE